MMTPSDPITPITRFVEEYFFLSNFYPSRIVMDEYRYDTLEHAFQASKTMRIGERMRIMVLATPGQAKRAGRTVTLRGDWEEVKLKVMADLLWQKFSSPDLRDLLLATVQRPLIEGNDWGDKYWGVCDNIGLNHLGRLLMAVRALLRGGCETVQSASSSQMDVTPTMFDVLKGKRDKLKTQVDDIEAAMKALEENPNIAEDENASSRP